MTLYRHAVTVCILAALLVPCHGADDTSDDSALGNWRVKTTDLPDGWKLAQDVEATPQQVEQIGSSLGVRLKQIINQVFAGPSGGKVQINLVSCYNPDDAAACLRSIVDRSHGRSTTVMPHEVVIADILASSKELRTTAMKWLKLPPLQLMKLNQAILPDGWRLLSETVIVSHDRNALAEQLDAKLKTVVVQSLDVQGEALQIRYIQPDDPADVTRVSDALQRTDMTQRQIFDRDGVVIEIQSRQTFVANDARKLLSPSPPAPKQ